MTSISQELVDQRVEQAIVRYVTEKGSVTVQKFTAEMSACPKVAIRAALEALETRGVIRKRPSQVDLKIQWDEIAYEMTEKEA